MIYFFNRFVLLAGMIVCAVLPLIELNVSQTNHLQEPVVHIENFFITSNTSLTSSNSDITPSNSPITSSNLPISKIALILYLTGLFITSISLFVSITWSVFNSSLMGTRLYETNKEYSKYQKWMVNLEIKLRRSIRYPCDLPPR